MGFFKRTSNGYIDLIGRGSVEGNISESEYNLILATIQNKPQAEEGYDYRLKEDLTWELYELPPSPPYEKDATEEDYKSALNLLGVNTDEEV